MSTKCKKCSQVVRQECDETLCDFEIQAKCVTVGALECIETEAGEDLQVVLEAIDEKLCEVSNLVGIYTIDSVCYVEGEGIQSVLVSVEPNFTHTTPLSISLGYYDVYTEQMFTNVFGVIVDGVVSGDTITLEYPHYGFPNPIDLEQDFIIMIVDNLGNYSERLTIEVGDLNPCG